MKGEITSSSASSKSPGRRRVRWEVAGWRGHVIDAHHFIDPEGEDSLGIFAFFPVDVEFFSHFFKSLVNEAFFGLHYS